VQLLCILDESDDDEDDDVCPRSETKLFHNLGIVSHNLGLGGSVISCMCYSGFPTVMRLPGNNTS
jgi:hypothetical protein